VIRRESMGATGETAAPPAASRRPRCSPLVTGRRARTACGAGRGGARGARPGARLVWLSRPAERRPRNYAARWAATGRPGRGSCRQRAFQNYGRMLRTSSSSAAHAG